MVRIIAFLLLFTSVTLWQSTSYALSEYGAHCDDNQDCRECQNKIDLENGLKCSECMRACWNKYGPAEYGDTETAQRLGKDKVEQCRLKWAKWCNAQCWDPDDKTNPDYVSTKPVCNKDYVYPKYKQSNPRPW